MTRDLDPHAAEYDALRHRLESEPLPANLGALLDEAIARFASAPAWIHIDRDLPPISWRELGGRVARAANALRGFGVGKGAHVGVMLPNVPDTLVIWLAIARLGATMVPINPSYTPRELHYWLTDGDVTTLVIDASRLATYEAVAAEAPLLRRNRVIPWSAEPASKQSVWHDMIAAASDAFVAIDPVLPEDVVNIQYTSGSTGLPKGCLLTHRYWIQCGKVIDAIWPGPKRLQCDLPFYYMGPFWRFALAAFSGAALCVPPSYSLSRFRERIREGRYDMAWMTDAVAMLEPRPDERDHALKMIATFGMNRQLRIDLAHRYGVPVRDAFGMTEIGFGSAVLLSDEIGTGIGSCGKVMPWRDMMIADAQGNPLQDDVLGELCVAGPGMLRGYHKKPEATAAAFHGKWFRTGDLCRRDARGYYFIVGRIKEMIRRSGENISITEVEGALSLHPDVEAVAVHGIDDEKRGEEVKACIILRQGIEPGSIDPGRFVAHAAQHLAPFKLPRYVQFYRSFPMTSSSKISRKRLRDGEGEAIGSVFDARQDR